MAPCQPRPLLHISFNSHTSQNVGIEFLLQQGNRGSEKLGAQTCDFKVQKTEDNGALSSQDAPPCFLNGAQVVETVWYGL